MKPERYEQFLVNRRAGLRVYDLISWALLIWFGIFAFLAMVGVL